MVIVKVRYLNKEMYYKTSLGIEELMGVEDDLDDVSFKELESFFDNSSFFEHEKNYQSSYQYVISLVEKEYDYLIGCADDEKAEIYLNKKMLFIKERNNLANAILQMYDCCESVEAVSVASSKIKPWNCNSDSWIDRTKENIILFFANHTKRQELAL